jgi:hypothetical protein
MKRSIKRKTRKKLLSQIHKFDRLIDRINAEKRDIDVPLLMKKIKRNDKILLRLIREDRKS